MKINTSIAMEQIICLTETWLNEQYESEELFSGDYVVFRKDRNYRDAGMVRGGGVLLAAKTNLNFRLQRMSEMECSLDRLEDVWVRIQISEDSWLYICTVYVSPFHGNAYLYREFTQKLQSTIQTLNANDEMLIVGDFNCPQLNGVFSSGDGCWDGSRGDLGQVGTLLLNTISLGNLRQCNRVSNSQVCQYTGPSFSK